MYPLHQIPAPVRASVAQLPLYNSQLLSVSYHFQLSPLFLQASEALSLQLPFSQFQSRSPYPSPRLPWLRWHLLSLHHQLESVSTLRHPSFQRHPDVPRRQLPVLQRTSLYLEVTQKSDFFLQPPLRRLQSLYPPSVHLRHSLRLLFFPLSEYPQTPCMDLLHTGFLCGSLRCFLHSIHNIYRSLAVHTARHMPRLHPWSAPRNNRRHPVPRTDMPVTHTFQPDLHPVLVLSMSILFHRNTAEHAHRLPNAWHPVFQASGQSVFPRLLLLS